jgi:hypothetical protein
LLALIEPVISLLILNPDRPSLDPQTGGLKWRATESTVSNRRNFHEDSALRIGSRDE